MIAKYLWIHAGQNDDKLPVEEHSTPASSVCPQLWIPHPLKEQLFKLVSLPVQATSSSHICPVPSGTDLPWRALTAFGYPSWRHTTLASFISQLSSQIVPHCPLWNISTRPVPFALDGPCSRIHTSVKWVHVLKQAMDSKLFYNLKSTFWHFMTDPLRSWSIQVLSETCKPATNLEYVLFQIRVFDGSKISSIVLQEY